MTDETVKQKKGKLPMHLILWKPVKWLVKIRMYGLKKYPNAENYKNVDTLDWYDACLRHLIAWGEQEFEDKESGYPHLAHALCNLCYLMEITSPSVEEFERTHNDT